MKFITALFLATIGYFSYSPNQTTTEQNLYPLIGLDTVEIRQYFACPGDTVRIQDTFFTASTVYYTPNEEEINSIEHQVNFSDFQFLIPNDTILLCEGDTLSLRYGAEISSNLDDNIPLVNDSIGLIPDGVDIYSGSIQIPVFDVVDTLVAANQIKRVCVNLEHSWMFDLNIKLKCPNGSSIFLHQQEFIRNEVFLGEPFELDDINTPNPPGQGIGYTYCWTPNPFNDTWRNYSQTFDPPTLPAGDYKPAESFDNLIGCPLSGEWTLEIIDGWPSDNGWVFYWMIEFVDFPVNNGLNQIVQQRWTGGNNVIFLDDRNLLATPELGISSYNYFVRDSFDCTYNTDLIVKVLRRFAGTPLTVDTTLCRGDSLGGIPIFEPGTYLMKVISETFCDSMVNYQVNLLLPDTSYTANPTCVLADVGISIDRFTNQFGCDSLIIQELFWEPDTMFVETTTCVEQEAGTFTATYFDQNGCQIDEIITRVHIPLNYTIEIFPDTCDLGLGGAAVTIEDSTQTYFFNWGGAPNEMSNRVRNLRTGFYDVTINSGDGTCGFAVAFDIPSIIPDSPTVLFNPVILEEDFSIHFENESEADTYFWEFGDGGFSTDFSPIHIYEVEGDYTVCLTGTNGCASKRTCKTITIQSSVELVKLKIGEKIGFNGETVAVPITCEDFNDITALSTQIAIANPSIGTFDSLQAYKLAREGFSVEEITPTVVKFNWTNPIGGNLTLSDKDTLMFVHINLSGFFGNTSGIFGEDLLMQRQEGDTLVEIRATIENGKVSISRPVDFIAGSVTTGSYFTSIEGDGVSDVVLNLQGTYTSQSTLTDTTGHYRVDTLAFGEHFILTPEKEGNHLNGLSTGGQIRILQHINETDTIASPFTLIAADTNCDEVIDTTDVEVIQELLMGERMAFEFCPSWTFIPVSHDFDLPSEPFPYPHSIEVMDLSIPLENLDFYGVKVGDVLGDANPLLRFPNEEEGDTLYLRANNKPLSQGEEVSIEFKFDRFERLLGYQFSLNYNIELLEFLDFEKGEIPDLRKSNFGLSRLEQGAFRSNWFNRQAIPTTLTLDAATSVRIRFRAKQHIPDLAPLFSLEKETFTAEAYEQFLIAIPIILQFDAITSASTFEQAGYQLYQSQPNPFNNATLLQFELPKGMQAQLVIHNQLGVEITRYSNFYQQGINQILVEDQVLKAEGIYYYTLIAGDYKRTRKMVKIK